MLEYKIKEEYNQIVKSFENVTKIAMLRIEVFEPTFKDVILRNFLAKSLSFLKSIHLLVTNHQYGEAMALYRLLIERYIYLEYLIKTDSFQEFSDWSYIKAYEIRNKMKSRSEFNDGKGSVLLNHTKEQTHKYQELKRINKWREPNLEKFSKELDLSILYSSGYDGASAHIHPRAEEGFNDALRIMKNEIGEPWRLDRIVNQSVLISNSIFMTALNYTSSKLLQPFYNYNMRLYDFLILENKLADLDYLEAQIIINLQVYDR